MSHATRRRTVPVFVPAAVLCTATLILARQDPVPQRPTFRAGIDLVQFDVSVLDKNRHPVRSLTAADFTIFEDDKPQPVAAFSAVDIPPPAPPPSAKWMREASPDVGTNDVAQNPEGRLFVLLIDDAMLPSLDLAAARSAREVARGVVDRLSPDDQVAVVFSLASAHVQNFTTDRGKLIRAIDTFKLGSASYMLGWDSGPGGRGVDGDILYREGSLETLRNVAETLIRAPQRRKALVFISPGITVDFSSAAELVPHEQRMGFAMHQANNALVNETPEVFRRMRAANVTIYPVDPCGLSGLHDYVLMTAQGAPGIRGVAPAPSDQNYKWLTSGNPPPASALARHMATVNMDFLMAAASNTGGHAIVNTNDFNPGLDSIFDENGSYYLLGYIKPPKDKPGSMHRVSVKVNRPGVTVRSRSLYETDAGDAATAKETKTALTTASTGPVASGELPLELALAPVVVAGRAEPAVTIVLGVRQPPVTTRAQETIELQTALFTPDGRAVGRPARQTARLTRVPGAASGARYELLTQFAAAPGRYEIRIAASRATDGLTGSVYADLEVPDFSKAPVSLSGVWLEARPGRTSVPADAFASLLPIVPTSSREFGTTDEVTAFFRIYQGGRDAMTAVPLSVRILDDHDGVVASPTGTIAVDRFDPATRSADHRFALPLRELRPGKYLLTFEVTQGESTARRDVVFTVR